MFVFQWHIDIPFGKQKEALDILRRWHEDQLNDPDWPKARRARLLTGGIGLSPSHIIAEWEHESLSAYESTMAAMATGRFKKHSEAIAPYIVPGSQHWVVLHVAQELPLLT